MPVILCTLVFTFYVYIRLYLMNIFSLQIFWIKNAAFHKILYDDLLRLKEEIELFFNRIPINVGQHKLNLGDHIKISQESAIFWDTKRPKDHWHDTHSLIYIANFYLNTVGF